MRPDGKDVEIKTLAKRSRHDILIKNVSLLGCEKAIEFERTESSLKIKSNEMITYDLPVCFKIEIE